MLVTSSHEQRFLMRRFIGKELPELGGVPHSNACQGARQTQCRHLATYCDPTKPPGRWTSVGKLELPLVTTSQILVSAMSIVAQGSKLCAIRKVFHKMHCMRQQQCLHRTTQIGGDMLLANAVNGKKWANRRRP